MAILAILAIMAILQLPQVDTQEFRYLRPLFPCIAPDGDRVQFLQRMKVTLVERKIFVQKYLADKITIIAADDVRVVLAHESLWR